MSLWGDKYRPTTLDKMSYHNGLSKHLSQLASHDNMPHLLFYGPPGAGKKTRLTAVLRAIYGPAVEKLKIEQRTFVTTASRKLNFTVVSSNFHIELNPSDLGIYDQVIMQDVIKDVAQSQQIDTNAKHQFKVIVIDQADELTREAQAALRRTMEKYTSNMRLIMCCTSLSKIIAPVRSRCLLLRVSRPTVENVTKVLQKVAKEEGVNLPGNLAVKIAEHSKCNLRAALLSFESMASQHPDLTLINRVDTLDWEHAISNIADGILQEQAVSRVLSVRGALYDLLSHCIEGTAIIKYLTLNLIKHLDEEMKRVTIDLAAKHQYRLRLGKKEIFHLEAFVIEFMHEYKTRKDAN
ncbi:putative subunit of DNA replication factor C (RF-C) [Phycomyces blakesleeanus]|uniref:Subunit of DNA replication factor C (RF-C) n=1 Tax=Phycomyces blakesleeanus TaxID=4837 RepID=A0ABR3AIN3_PHYBL